MPANEIDGKDMPCVMLGSSAFRQLCGNGQEKRQDGNLKKKEKASWYEAKILKIIKVSAGMKNANGKAKKYGKYVKLKLKA